MKRAILFLIILALSFSLTSCMFYLPVPYEPNQSKDNIAAIEIYYLQYGAEHPERHDYLDPAVTLTQDQYELFINDLQVTCTGSERIDTNYAEEYAAAEFGFIK